MTDKFMHISRVVFYLQASVNQVKASISELENTEESQIEDISTLVSLHFTAQIDTITGSTQRCFLIYAFCCYSQEEEAQEIEQKIDLERRNVEETKSELDKQDKVLFDINRKFQDNRNKMEQLSDDSEQLKVSVIH